MVDRDLDVIWVCPGAKGDCGKLNNARDPLAP